MSFTVKVQCIPGGTKIANYEDPITVRRAIMLTEQVEKPEGWTVKLGGEDVANLDKEISTNSTITLIRQKVKGNDS